MVDLGLDVPCEGTGGPGGSSFQLSLCERIEVVTEVWSLNRRLRHSLHSSVGVHAGGEVVDVAGVGVLLEGFAAVVAPGLEVDVVKDLLQNFKRELPLLIRFLRSPKLNSAAAQPSRGHGPR